MPHDSLSEKDRLRLAALMKAPLISSPRQQPGVTGKSFVQSWQTARRVVERHWNRQWATIAGAAIVCMAGLILAVALNAHHPVEGIQLRALDRQGQLQIRWDPNAVPIRDAREARLFIIDGGQRIFVTLDPPRLRRGELSYERQTAHVDLRMAVDEPDGRLIEEKASFAGGRPASPAPVSPVPVNPAPEQPDLFAKRVAKPADIPAPEAQIATAVAPRAPVVPQSAQADSLQAEHRSRKKPQVLSGTALPFTCDRGDVFHKTDAPAGWDTFGCRAKNVWSLIRSQADDRSTNKPSADATTLTAKPATASTT